MNLPRDTGISHTEMASKKDWLILSPEICGLEGNRVNWVILGFFHNKQDCGGNALSHSIALPLAIDHPHHHIFDTYRYTIHHVQLRLASPIAFISLIIKTVHIASYEYCDGSQYAMLLC